MSGPGDTKTYDANGVMASVYDPALRALRISGSGASGAPVNASYVTMVSESGLSNETVLGTGVIMAGTLGARPAAATAGRLYYASDNGIIYRDTGSAWVAITGASTGVVVLAPASSATNVIQSTADATELTLKAFAGQASDVFVIKDEEGNEWLTTAVASASGVVNGSLFLGDNNTQLHVARFQLIDDGFARTTEIKYQAQSDLAAFASIQYEIVSNIDGSHDLASLEFQVNDGGSIYFYCENTRAYQQMIAATGQTEPVIEIKDENHVDAFRVMQNGQAISNAHAVPADGLLNNSDFAVWLDDTPGATFLKCKMKDSGGTVRTFSIPAT